MHYIISILKKLSLLSVRLIQSKSTVKVIQLCLTLSDPTDCSPPGSSVHGILQARITGVGCHFLLQGIFPPRGSKLGLLQSRQILYHLNHQQSPLHLIY